MNLIDLWQTRPTQRPVGKVIRNLGTRFKRGKVEKKWLLEDRELKRQRQRRYYRNHSERLRAEAKIRHKIWWESAKDRINAERRHRRLLEREGRLPVKVVNR